MSNTAIIVFLAIKIRSGLKPPGKKSIAMREEKNVVGRGKAADMNMAKHDSASTSGIRYKYQEGFSAAVRRRVKIADLL